MILGFSNLGYKNITYVLAGYERGKIVSLNEYLSILGALYVDMNSLLFKTTNYYLVRYSYKKHNAYDYIFFADNYYDDFDQIVKLEYDRNGYLINKLIYSESNELIARTEFENYSDEGYYGDQPNLWSSYNKYGTRERQGLISFDELGRIAEISWEFIYRKPQKKLKYFYTKNQEYVFKIFINEKGMWGEPEFYIESLDIYKLNIFNKIEFHANFKEKSNIQSNVLFFDEFREYQQSNNESNKIIFKYYEGSYSNNFISLDSMNVTSWSKEDYFNLFKRALKFVNQYRDEINIVHELHDTYSNDIIIERSIMEYYKSDGKPKGKYEFKYEYGVNEKGDWNKRITYGRNRLHSKSDMVTEERRDITYW